MKTKRFFGFLLPVATIILTLAVSSCTDETWIRLTPEPEPNSEKNGATLVDGSLDIKHDWKYSNTLVSDVVTSMALLDVKKDGKTRTEEINQLLPFEIKWSQPEEMSRGTKVFTLQDQNLGKAQLKASENNDNITLKTYEQNFEFFFDGMQISFETSYQTATSKYEGVDLANCILDEIKYIDQKPETVERFFIGDRSYIRSKVTFTFEVKRHHTHDNSKHTDYLYPYVYVNAPEVVDPEEDIFNGAIIIGGTEKLFFNRKLDDNTNIYTSQVDVWEFWTVSGKKRVTYSTELEIKQWIDDEKEAWIVPSIEIGYPNLKEVRTKTSEDYVKENINDYVFQKTSSDWSADWQYANNYNIGVYGSSERAWKTYKGLKVVAMPYDIHKFAYDADKYSYGNYTEKVSEGKTYLSYPAKVYFDATFNGDTYVLNQSQEFWVEKGTVPPPTEDELISEKILYELENTNNKWISKIIFRRTYSQTGERDSVATQELKRETKVDDNKRFVRPNNTLSLKDMLDPVKVSENTETDQTTGHVITTIVNRHTFDFDFFTFNIEETYQTAYTMYKGERLNFLAPTPEVVLSGQKPEDMGTIVDADGTKYNRTEYTLTFKETYGNFNAMYYPLVDIDVKPEEVTRTEWRVMNEGLERISDTQWKSYFTLYEKFSDGKETNTYKEVLLDIYVQAPAKRNLQLNSAEFDYTSLTPRSVSTSTRSGGQNITVTTLKSPYDLVYTSRANERLSSEFNFVSETAVYKDGDITVNFKSVDWMNIQNEGYSAPLQGLVGDYNRYNAAFNISGQYNGVTYPATALVDVDVLVPQDPTIDPEWGEIDIEKTKKFGTISVAWEAQAGNEKLLPIYTGTIITSKGIISFMKGYKQFTAMNTNTITDQVGNAWNGTKLFPSYIEVDRSGKNISWAYLSVIDGELFDDVNSSKMTLEGGLNKETPFVATGGDANVYTFSENGNVVRVVVTYQGVVMFDEVFNK